MVFLMMFMRKIKGEPRHCYARIYHTRPYPMGIRSMIRVKRRTVPAKEQNRHV